MPKRSNDFQKLIYDIYKQLSPVGATVTESALLPERNNSTAVEVDILIEHEVAGHHFRMAIECRDRGRKADKPWINDIIGKYKDLEVNKIVAVSRSGFTKGATEKAKANNIETLTLEEATEANWRQEFVKLKAALIGWRDQCERIRMQFLPPLPEEYLRNRENFKKMIYRSLDEEIQCQSLEDFLRECYLEAVPDYFKTFIYENIGTIFDDISVPQKTLGFNIPIPILEIYFILLNETVHVLRGLIFDVRCNFTFEERNFRHYTYNQDKVGISMARINSDIMYTIIQTFQPNDN